jgi:energy-coupling factor transport system permease protein
MTTSSTGRVRRPPVILRPVPGDTVMHRMWAGTKLISVTVIGVLVAVYPLWPAIAVAAALSTAAVILARIPRSALPSPPRWAWIALLLSMIGALVAGGDPVLAVGPVDVGLGNLVTLLRFFALTLIVLGSGALVSWTTHIADIAPAVAVLGRPLRWLRIPVDDWAAAIALGLRAFPMLIDEFRVLYAARRMRPKPALTGWRERGRYWLAETVDLLAATVTVALRRADEMGDAITARGGAGRLSATPSRPRRRDFVTIGIVVAVCGATAVGEFLAVGIS